MNNILIKRVSLVVMLLLALQGFSQKNYKYESVENDPLKVRIYTLDNGLKVYMSVYKDAPRIQTAIAVRTGSKNDPDDNTGLSHYLEHLMFKGTTHFSTKNFEKENYYLLKIDSLFEAYRKLTDTKQRKDAYKVIDSISNIAATFAIANEYDKMMAALGVKGTNAYTSVEQTVYVNDVPSNQFNKWVDIEYDRFTNPIFRIFHTELDMRYHVAYILPGTKSYWSLCLGEHDNSLFTRQYDCDLTIVKVIGLNHKMFIVNAVERGKWFSNSLVHATKDGKLHTNKDNYPKEHLSILETKMKEGLILQGLVARYKADFPEVLHQAIKALVMS